MSLFTKLAQDIFAAVVPGGASRRVKEAEAQVWGTEVERLLQAFGAGGGIIFADKATADANLAYAAHTMAWVLGDSTPANNGIYRKSGASGAGSWIRQGDLPYSFVRMVDVGAGTANAIQLTSTIPTSLSVIRVANVFEANSGDVTISENGAAVKSLRTNSGNQIAAGGLVAGSLIVYMDDGTNFRLLSDQASAAIQAAAEAAAAAAALSAAAAQASVDLRPELAKGYPRIAAMMDIDRAIQGNVEARPKFTARSDALVEDILNTYTAVTSVTFVAMGQYARIVSNGYMVNAVGGDNSGFVKTDISGVASTDSYEQVHFIPSTRSANFATFDIVSGLVRGTSYTARLLSKQAGSSAGYDARGELIVETY